jgi:hypothetical protein
MSVRLSRHSKLVTINCDTCRAIGRVEALTTDEARRVANEEAGWTSDDRGRDLCADCTVSRLQRRW